MRSQIRSNNTLTAHRQEHEPDRPDGKLVEGCLAGDHGAWESIVQTHHQRVYNLAYRYCGRFDEAEDLTQEIFFKVYRTLGAYRSDSGAFGTWLLRVSRNHIIDRYRKHRTERSLTDAIDSEFERIEENPARYDTPAESYRKREVADFVHAALLEMSTDLREAVILRDLEGCTYDEMASILDVPLGTVKSRINRGRTELGRLMRGMRDLL
jgi:RNA polymerase sigma-70 factor (ECF subfamily)